MNLDCIFCTTPFQIMTALNLRINQNNENETDLYVVDQFKNAESVSEKIKELNIFRKVVLIHENEIINKDNTSELALWPQMVLSYIKLNRTAKVILKENYKTHYDIMYVSSKAFTSRVVAMYYAKNDFNTKMVYYDDGLGSYFDRSILYPRVADKALRFLLLGKRAKLINPREIMLYAPDLFENLGINNNNDVSVSTINSWSRKETFIDVMNKVFSYHNDDAINEPIIIFDGLYYGEQKDQIEHFYKQVINIAGKENVIIKKHPRDTEPEQEGMKYYKRSDVPFELLCLNNSMKDKLLITFASTAVVTPKLLLNEEPRVLALNRIQEISANNSIIDFDVFRNLYSDKNVFLQATSQEQALNFIEEFYKNQI